MCVVMETNELTSIDEKLVDTSTIHTTMSIHSLLNINSRVGGWTKGRKAAALLPQGASLTTPHFPCHLGYRSPFDLPTPCILSVIPLPLIS